MIEEILPPHTAVALPAMSALRPGWADEQAFVERIDGTQRPEGYRLVGKFEPGRAEAVAVAGFRVGHNLAWGRYLYADDLSTLPAARRRGYARAVLDWLVEEAHKLGCDQLHLDSGVGPARAHAHRLYLSAGMVISSHHFVLDLASYEHLVQRETASEQ
jgi:GNAT superfamily N-acetyltransferase